jgi:branched-chain amino acid transport system ATP-binding protein
MSAAPLLKVEGLETAYGASQVLFGVDLEVRAGEVVGLLGRNGMGKTTLLRSVFGLVSPRSGSVAFAGREVRGASADTIARLGLALVPEGRQVFPNLSVDEHLTAFAARRGGEAHGAPWDAARVYALFPRLAERRDNLGNQLSGGEQQMLAIGRALVTNPRLLILDEATEGLAPLVREEIWRCLRALREAGQTILVVDKYVNRLIGIADRHLILERGRVVWRGSSAELDADREAWRRYLGV